MGTQASNQKRKAIYIMEYGADIKTEVAKDVIALRYIALCRNS